MMDIVGATFDSESIKMIQDISEAKKNSVRAKDDATYHKKISDLMYENYVYTVCKYKTAWDVMEPTIIRAWKEKQVDKKKKSEREELEFLHYKIQNYFFKDKYKFKIKEIISAGYSTYGWTFKLEINKEEYEIFVPMRSKLDTNNFEYAYSGQFALLKKKNEACWDLLKSAYTEEEIADWIEEYFKKQGVDEDA